MILCLEEDEVGKVRDLYFLSISAKKGLKNAKFKYAASYRTNPIFSAISEPEKHLTPDELAKLNQCFSLSPHAYIKMMDRDIPRCI